MSGIWRAHYKDNDYLIWRLIEGIGRYRDEKRDLVVETGRVIAAKGVRLTWKERQWLEEQVQAAHRTLLDKVLNRLGQSLEDWQTGGIDKGILPEFALGEPTNAYG